MTHPSLDRQTVQVDNALEISYMLYLVLTLYITEVSDRLISRTDVARPTKPELELGPN